MNEDTSLVPDAERARTEARDRKLRGPKVIEDNPGLKKLQMQLALRRRAARTRAKR